MRYRGTSVEVLVDELGAIPTQKGRPGHEMGSRHRAGRMVRLAASTGKGRTRWSKPGARWGQHAAYR